MKRAPKISQAMVNAIIFVLLIVIVFLMTYSRLNLQKAISREQQAVERKIMSQSLGNALYETSNYLTDEARLFVITGKRIYLDNYLTEINRTKRREDVIKKLNGLELLSEEKWLLNAAKLKSDELIEVELDAMRLGAYSLGMTGYDMDYYAAPHNNMDKAEDLSKYTQDEALGRALSILSDVDYLTKKEIIYGYIKDFQNLVDLRMSREAKRAATQTKEALLWQSIAQLTCVALVLALLFIIIAAVMRPALHYSERLMNKKETKLKPRGIREIYMLGEAIKKMHSDMYAALQSKSRYLAVMSHEIRSPLHSMSGYIFLLKGTKLDKAQREYADYLDGATSNLLDIVNDILSNEKRENKNPERRRLEEFDIKKLMNILEMDFARQCADKSIGFSTSIEYAHELGVESGNDIIIYADALHIRQIITNLLSNAVKFTSSGCIRADAVVRERKLEITVSDTGIGIRAENIERIFEAYEQENEDTQSLYGGTGLGLGICREMAHEMSGEIYVSSEYKKGSRFTLKVPILTAKAAGEEADPAAESSETSETDKTSETNKAFEINKTFETNKTSEITETDEIYGISEIPETAGEIGSLDKYRARNPESREKAEGMDWSGVCSIFAGLVRNGDFEVAEFFRPYREHFAKRLGDEETARIEKYIASFDYKGLLEIIQDMEEEGADKG